MKFLKINSDSDLSVSVKVLNESHGTVAIEFGFTKETNPSNSAFIDTDTLKSQLEKGIELFLLMNEKEAVGCIAIEKSIKGPDTFFIEKVSVVPEYRHKGFGKKLMDFASDKIKNDGGKWVSIALINSNVILKKWYVNQGFVETGVKDFPHLPFKVCFMNKNID
jgi:ribosomal protein S18 acetylase RimI-like enzyme